MKKIFIGILLIFAVFPINSGYIYAADATATTVTVTEQIPGLSCTPAEGSSESPEKRKYKCKVEGTFGTVMLMLRGLLKYVAFLAILISVLMLVISGVKMSIEGKKEDSKKMFNRVIVAIIVLFTMGLILNTIAPWVYK